MSKPRVYVLESKYHGSNQQLVAFARECFKGHELITLRLESRTRARTLFPFLKLLAFIAEMVGQRNIFAQSLKRLSLTGYPKNGLYLGPNDVVVSKTPPFEYPSVMLRAGSSAVSYHFGALKRWPRRFFENLISTPSTPVADADYVLETLPTSVTFEVYKETYCLTEPYNLFLIGGDARGFSYDEKDWRHLVRFINDFAKKSGTKWVISTSPRTPPEFEKLLQEQLKKSAIRELACWGEGHRKPLIDCLSGARIVFVTEDSASMLSDAVNCQLPTISVRPLVSGYNSLTTPLAKELEKKGRILRCTTRNVEALPLYNGAFRGFAPIERCWTEALPK